MANQFTSLPAPAANGAGAWVDVSTYGGLKTVTVKSTGFNFQPQVTIEITNQAVPTIGAPACPSFQTPGEQTFTVASRWMRAVVTNYRGGPAPDVELGGDDEGALFANLPVPAGNGAGASVDVHTLGAYKTVTVGGPFRGGLQVEISEDGGASFATAASFNGVGGQVSFLASADCARVIRNGVPEINPGAPVVNLGGVDISGAIGPPGPAGPAGPAGPNGPGDLGWFGTGIDGSPVLGGDLNLDRDMFYVAPTINAPHTLHTNGYRVYFSTGPIGDGTIDNSGSDGAVHVGGAGAPAGTLLGGGQGGSTGFPETTLPGGAGTNAPFWPIADAGGAGGDGGDATDAGGSGGVTSPGFGTGPYMVGTMAIGDALGGGAGGGGGAVDSGGTPGGGGGGAGPMVLSAKTFASWTGTIRAKGGAGAAATAGNAGGGGGGMGAPVVIITNDPARPASIDVTGGAGAAGSGTGTAGAHGEDGVVIAISPAYGPI